MSDGLTARERCVQNTLTGGAIRDLPTALARQVITDLYLEGHFGDAAVLAEARSIAVEMDDWYDDGNVLTLLNALRKGEA